MRAAALGDVREYFVDAGDGTIAFEFSDLKTQSAVGRGQGVLGDTKKISVSPSGGQFVTTDRLRPPAINTYDMRGDYVRTIDYLNDVIQLTTNDLGADSDNTWTDGATVDAHVYAGWTYDYFYKRFDRRGLDNRDLPLVSLVHPVRRSDFLQVFPLVPDFYLNAGYYGDGIMVYGEGLPAGFTAGGQTDRLLLGGARRRGPRAHPRRHRLHLQPDLPERIGRAQRSVLGHDGNGGRVLLPAARQRKSARRLPARRRMSSGREASDRCPIPQAYGDPDHYSRRYTGPEDNGGVHINSGIANNAFYLAIEGGTNRTSGLAVQGVGAANREQVERVFYRAFTQMLPANATFAMARAATIQSARDIFGANSAAERAITQAWTAVGVN